MLFTNGIFACKQVFYAYCRIVVQFIFAIHICHAGKKAGMTTSGTYQRGQDAALLSYPLQGTKPLGNPHAYRSLTIHISLLSIEDASFFITDQFCLSPSSILDASCFFTHLLPSFWPSALAFSCIVVYGPKQGSSLL